MKKIPTQLLVPVSLGELIDKMSILKIKVEKFTGLSLSNVSNELALLNKIKLGLPFSIDTEILKELDDVNLKLWEIEDSIRHLESEKTFDNKFIELARAVYINNDKRASLKAIINKKYGSQIIEEKGYSKY